jgi:hypothetical protein
MLFIGNNVLFPNTILVFIKKGIQKRIPFLVNKFLINPKYL